MGSAKGRVAWPGSYPLIRPWVGAHTGGKVTQLLADLSWEVPAPQALWAEGGGRWVPE